jgi:hypothetical protein
MNLTEQQKELLRNMVDAYTGGCYEPFLFVETPSQEASLVYPGRPAVAVAAITSDVLSLRDEGLIDCQLDSSGAPSGKPSANGIVLVQRNFSEDIPIFPDIKPDSIKMSRFFHILDEDLGDEDSVNLLMAQMCHTPEAAFYFFQRNASPVSPPLQAAFGRGDILDALYERLYFRHPKSQRDFLKIAGAEIGLFNWDWERAVVEKGPEYARRTLKLSERKRREMETLEKIHLEMAYRQQIWEEQIVRIFFSAMLLRIMRKRNAFRRLSKRLAVRCFLPRKAWSQARISPSESELLCTPAGNYGCW